MHEAHKLADLEPISITPSVSTVRPNDLTLPQYQQWSVERPQHRNRMVLTDLTVDIPESHRVPKNAPETKPKARWKAFEFRIYTAVACVMIPVMAWVPISLSLESHPNYKLFERRLSPGWIPYRKVDNSDAQYRGFRNNFWLLTGLASIYLFVRYFWTRLGTSTPPDNTYLFRFKLLCSLVFLFGLHGTSLLKILIILAANYAIAYLCGGSKAGPVLTWVFNCTVLFINDRFNGYQFGEILPSLEMLPKNHNPTNHAERMAPHLLHMYTFPTYLSYILYPPLYIAGPIMTFNDYLWQHRRPTPVSGRSTGLYLFRLLASIVTMELILHFMYVVAIKDARAWVGATPAQVSLIGFWNLIIVWLKLLIPWRFFRLWALVDGIEAPENMVRCMANNYSTLGFWRSWHRSYNLWIIRYIYIPLGGAKRVLLNTLLVFTFVALWHDLTFKLLAWGWLVSLFVVPEVLATYLLPASKYGSKPWYRHVCAAGGVLNVLMMMAANLVGFVIGADGVGFFAQQLFGTAQGLAFLAATSAVLFVGVQLMFEYRTTFYLLTTVLAVSACISPLSSSSSSSSSSSFSTSDLSRAIHDMAYKDEYPPPKQAELQIDFLIVGGGLSGLACAVALRRIGHRVVVLEADKTLDVNLLGGCRMAPNLAKILYHWGLHKELEAIVLKSQAIDLMSFHTGERLGTHIWDEEMLRETRGEFIFAHYADFRRLLYDTAVSLGADVRLGTPVASMDPGAQTVTLESGEVLTADVVIGADGAYGLARATIDDTPAKPHQFVMYSTTVPKKAIMADPELRYLYDKPYRTMYSWFGNGCAGLGFPLGGKEEFALFAYGPPNGCESTWTEPALLEGMRSCLENSEIRLRKLGELATYARCVPVQEFSALEDWVHDSGRMLLIGEAAHPYPAGAIQTCAMAIEDGAVLAKLFSHLRTEDQISSFLYAFETLRQPRCAAVCTKEFGDIYFMSMPPGEHQEGRDAHFRGRRDRGLNVLDADSAEEETPQWTEIKEVFGYDAEDEADNWWQEWGLLRERAAGRAWTLPDGTFGSVFVEQQVGV
ncbi:hypothetical protein DXG01_009176 [Tephrocybe rancida]|nr:hypothetical protein DXG01_009176 [Tephrocybe rancida]